MIILNVISNYKIIGSGTHVQASQYDGTRFPLAAWQSGNRHARITQSRHGRGCGTTARKVALGIRAIKKQIEILLGNEQRITVEKRYGPLAHQDFLHLVNRLMIVEK